MATILIVDDDDALRTLLRRVLKRAGYDTREAANGREALSYLREQPVDLMITDLFMPQQDGLETILELRRMNIRLPIIAMSGGGSAAQYDMLRTASLFGAARVLMKPFRAEEVLAAIDALLPPKPPVVQQEEPPG
jgi:DNA-binding response OmpR family regulator